MPTNDLAILILAAGKSTRLGQPKQLLLYENETLLRRAVKQALTLSHNVFVVLGDKKAACINALHGLPIHIVYNKAYAKGIGCSIACGIQETQTFAHTMIMLCDQPLIPTSHYKTLALSVRDAQEKIVASCYENESKSAVPAIFPKTYYDALLTLDGDKGAQFLLNSQPCFGVSLPKALAIDIDTLEDVKSYLN